MIKLASLKETDLTQVTQVLYSKQPLDANSNFKILEVDKHLLEALKVGDWFVKNKNVNG